MRCTRCSKTVFLVVILLTMAISAVPAFGQSCLQDQYSKVNSQNLGCTANDVRVAEAINTRALDGTTLSQCIPGKSYNFIADFLVQTSSNKTRSNIGLYFAIGDPTKQTQALTGSCSDNIIGGPGRYFCTNQTAATALCGSTHYDELDTSQFPTDNCGDTSSTDPTVCLSKPDPVTGNAFVTTCPAPAGGSTWTGTQVVTVEIDGFVCPNTPGQNVVLPDCTSWQIPGKAIQCVSAAPHYPYPFDTSGNPEAIPGSPSKCNCSAVTLPIIVQSPSITVTKNCDATAGGGTASNFPTVTPASCTLPDPGASTANNVTYTVGIANGSNFGDIAVDQICDSVYGTVYKASGYTGAPCGVAGTISSSNTTCTSTLLNDVPPSGTSCTFSVFQAEAKTVSDTLMVTVHGLSGGTSISGTSNTATVTSGEATTSGTITKAAETITNACASVKYTTTVTNTSTAPEETLTLSKLFDDSVDISSTCTGSATLPQPLTGPAGSYTCEFTAPQFCGTPQDVIKTAGTCSGGTCTTGALKAGLPSCSQNSDCDVHCTGIQKTDTVTATLTDDEGNTVTLTPGSATATMCITGP